MYKSWKGYLTVEASFIMPIVIFIYVLIILCGFYLYDRCVISQDNYLLAFRGSRFTDAGGNYGKVIYGDMKTKEPDHQYVEERLAYKIQFYPFYYMEANKIKAEEDSMIVGTTGYSGTLDIIKKSERLNIIEIVERVRSK